MAYKLVRYARRPVLKLSARKQTLVCDKQVFRTEEKGRLDHDTIALRAETCRGNALLKHSLADGRRLQHPESLDTIAKRFKEEFSRLDDSYKALLNPKIFPVHLSPELEELQGKMLRKVREKELGES
jgi:nicotinate phosphoribosyltransferase